MTQKGALAGCWNYDLGLPASGAGKEYVPVVWVTPSVDLSWHPLANMYLNCQVGRTLSLRTAVGRGRGRGRGRVGWDRSNMGEGSRGLGEGVSGAGAGRLIRQSG